jgi:hypothetical protein
MADDSVPRGRASKPTVVHPPRQRAPTSRRAAPRRFEKRYHGGMSLDERAFFNDKPETRQGRYQCPKCRRTSDYSIRWVRRSKKDRLPGGADEADRAKFAKLRDYLLRLEDEVTCKTCGKKFEIPSHRNVVFLEELEGLPQTDDEEDEEN